MDADVACRGRRRPRSRSAAAAAAVVGGLAVVAGWGVRLAAGGNSFTVLRAVPGGCRVTTTYGDKLAVNYVGSIDETSATGERGLVFDDSHAPGKTPFTFVLGYARVIRGWEWGLRDMCVGEVRRLVLSPENAYGDQQIGPIPPHATLRFDIELVAEQKGSDEHDNGHSPDYFSAMDKNKDRRLDRHEVDTYNRHLYGDSYRQIFDEHDGNGDGHITWDEFRGEKGAPEMVAGGGSPSTDL